MLILHFLRIPASMRKIRILVLIFVIAAFPGLEGVLYNFTPASSWPATLSNLGPGDIVIFAPGKPLCFFSLRERTRNLEIIAQIIALHLV